LLEFPATTTTSKRVHTLRRTHTTVKKKNKSRRRNGDGDDDDRDLYQGPSSASGLLLAACIYTHLQCANTPSVQESADA